MSRLSLPAIAAISLAFVACDPSAKAKDGEGPSARSAQLSGEWESCSASTHCAGDLRCFENMCRATSVSALGDYYWALGNRLSAEGEIDGALEAFNSAVGQYKAGGAKSPPAALLCDQGRAMARGAADGDLAEQAAQVLHRCMLAVPVSSPLRARALRGLAVLADTGLDPNALAGDTTAPKYMTGDAKKKTSSVDTVQLSVSSDQTHNKKSFTGWMAKLQTPDTLALLRPCWQQHNEATKAESLVVTLEFRSKYYEGEFASQDRYVLSVGAAPAGVGSACVHGVVKTLLEEFSARGSWKANMTLTLAPQG
jgi:hypothetical protein